MKRLKVFGICALLAVSNQSFANIIPITFAKGSYCGSFEGDYTNRTFTLSTRANQTIFVTIKDGARDVSDIVVIDPRGRTNRADGAELEFITRTAGSHKIKVIPYNDFGFANIEFCAY